jgi:parvulin-like peptidyl-prolyl isomerase
MRWWFILCLLGAVPLPGFALVFDQAVRYVNDQVLSLGDVRLRNQQRLAECLQRGQPRPGTRAEALSFSQESLVQLTDEELLVQYAKQLEEKFHHKLVDRERIAQRVAERVRATGRHLTLREQADERRQIERAQSIETLFDVFGRRSAQVSPAEQLEAYRHRPDRYRRPARAKVLQIIMRPSPAAERDGVRQAGSQVLKRAQELAEPEVKEVVARRLEAYLVAAPEAQDGILADTIKELAELAGKPGLGSEALALVQEAQRVQAQTAALGDAEQVFRQLSELRDGLTGKDAAAFQEAARRVSKGPNAERGGELGWIEPGFYPAAFDERVFALKPGELSPVFAAADQSACLVLVVEREEARVQSFDEVRGQIESELSHERDEEFRRQTIAMLRAQASIRDVLPLESAFE